MPFIPRSAQNPNIRNTSMPGASYGQDARAQRVNRQPNAPAKKPTFNFDQGQQDALTTLDPAARYKEALNLMASQLGNRRGNTGLRFNQGQQDWLQSLNTADLLKELTGAFQRQRPRFGMGPRTPQPAPQGPSPMLSDESGQASPSGLNMYQPAQTQPMQIDPTIGYYNRVYPTGDFPPGIPSPVSPNGGGFGGDMPLLTELFRSNPNMYHNPDPYFGRPGIDHGNPGGHYNDSGDVMSLSTPQGPSPWLDSGYAGSPSPISGGGITSMNGGGYQSNPGLNMQNLFMALRNRRPVIR